MTPRFGIVATAASAQASLDLIEEWESAGLDDAVWGDHWMGLYPPEVADEGSDGAADRWYHALALMAVAAERTTTVRLAIGVTDLLRRHPADVAQALLTIAELHPDRDLVVGVGLGETENVTPFGLAYYPRVARLREAISLLRSFVSTGSVADHDGIHFQLRGAALEPRHGADRVRIWLAAHGPRMLELCGELADGWYPLATSPRHYGRQLAAVRTATAATGRRDQVEAGLAINICVVEDDAAAERAANDPVLRGFALWSAPSLFERAGLPGHPLVGDSGGFAEYVPSWISAGQYREAIARVPPEVVRRAVLIGTESEICHQLHDYALAGAESIFLWDVNRMRGREGREIDVVAHYRDRAASVR
jgi:phthiodiolone/phenolphthiodiolone dimycocerosates ketoreductase